MLAVPPLSRGAGYTGREPRVAAIEAPTDGVEGPGRVCSSLPRERTARGGAFARRSHGNEPLVGNGARDRGELAEEKRGESSDPGHPQPIAAEVESARLLENAAAERLGARAWVGMRSAVSRTSTSRSISVRTPTSSSAGP